MHVYKTEKVETWSDFVDGVSVNACCASVSIDVVLVCREAVGKGACSTCVTIRDDVSVVGEASALYGCAVSGRVDGVSEASDAKFDGKCET